MAKPDDGSALILTVMPDDGKPPDVEHGRITAMLAEGWPLDRIRRELRRCARPAFAVAEWSNR